MIRRIILTIVATLSFLSLSARELKVESFKLLPNDISARTNPRTNADGEFCALIKVSLPIENVKFWGSIVSSKFDVNEYLVYVNPNTEGFIVDCPGFEPFKVITTIGGYPVEGKNTYQLQLSGYDKNTSSEPQDVGGNFMVLDILTKEAKNISVRIDGEIKALSGTNQLKEFLFYGKHTYSVEAPGFKTVTGDFDISGESETKVDVTLKSNSSNISIVSHTKDSQIKINEEYRGANQWTGELLPGTYKIEVSHPSYVPYITSIHISQSTDTILNISDLEPIFGTILVGVKPAGATVLLDEKEVGTTPLKLENVLIGSCLLTVLKDGYDSFSTQVMVSQESPVIVKDRLSKIKDGLIKYHSPDDSNEDYIINNSFFMDAAEGRAAGHEYVDLGLPSGLKWAAYNVGAAKPSDYGEYYAWAEIKPIPKKAYKMEKSKYSGKRIGDISGNPNYDVAASDWGDAWRMPTEIEWVELLETCNWHETEVDNIRGYNIIGPNGNAIFLPFAGRDGSHANKDCYYWSSIPSDIMDHKLAKGVEGRFYKKRSRVFTIVTRSYGLPIRPVRK